MRKTKEAGGSFGDIRWFIGELFGSDLHAKRVDSLAGATLGVMTGASLAVAMIGHALAQARGLVTKHAVKQVDRLLSNDGINVWDSFARWVPHEIAGRQAILVAMDWTNFDHDDQATLVLGLVTGHGRAAPLLWLTVWKEELKNRRNDYEDAWPTVASATRSCLPFSVSLALITLSASVAISRLPTPMDRPSRRPIGWARVDALANCATPASRRRVSRSARSSACMPKT
jgi:hypothetical protein